MAWRLLEAGFLRLEFGDSLTWSCAWSWGGVATTEDYRCLRWQATCHVATSGVGEAGRRGNVVNRNPAN